MVHENIEMVVGDVFFATWWGVIMAGAELGCVLFKMADADVAGAGGVVELLKSGGSATDGSATGSATEDDRRTPPTPPVCLILISKTHSSKMSVYFTKYLWEGG